MTASEATQWIELIRGLHIQDTLLFVAVGLGLIMTAIEKSAIIRYRPWTAIARGIGRAINGEIYEKIDKVSRDLTEHIKEDREEKLRSTRAYILDFANSCMQHRKHTYEEFRFVLKKCDDYETHIEQNHLKNGEISSAIREIRRIEAKCRQENSFLKEGEGDGSE